MKMNVFTLQKKKITKIEITPQKGELRKGQIFSLSVLFSTIALLLFECCF